MHPRLAIPVLLIGLLLAACGPADPPVSVDAPPDDLPAATERARAAGDGGAAGRSDLAEPESHAVEPVALEVSAVEAAGAMETKGGRDLAGSPLGGFSGLAWDPGRGSLLVLSDDRGEEADPRFFRARLSLDDGRLDEDDLRWEGLTLLTDGEGRPFERGALDPEGLALGPDGRLYLASEGDAESEPPLPPAVLVLDAGGRLMEALSLPDAFLPDGQGQRGVRDNRGFEGLALSPDGRWLVAGTQGPLAQEPAPGAGEACAARLLAWRLPEGELAGQWRYPLDPPPGGVMEGCEGAGRLVELAGLDAAGGLLALERVGGGDEERARLYALRLDAFDPGGAAPTAAASGAEPPPWVEKHLLADFDTLGIDSERLEGMALGPSLPDGRRALLLVGDDDFEKKVETPWLMLALELRPR